jgi:hypothetical protein
MTSSIRLHSVSLPLVYQTSTRKGGSPNQTQGSTQGGTLLWISGNEFARTDFSKVPSSVSGNAVILYRGDRVYECTLQIEEVTSTRLACTTVAMPAGFYDLRIYVNGEMIPSSGYPVPEYVKFESTLDNTPRIFNIWPAIGEPQRLVTLSGDFKTNCSARDVNACAREDAPIISR